MVNYKKVSAELARRLFSQGNFLYDLANQYGTPDRFADAYTSIALNRKPGEMVSLEEIEDLAWRELLESHGEDITNQIIQKSSDVLRKEFKRKIAILFDDYIKDARGQSAA